MGLAEEPAGTGRPAAASIRCTAVEPGRSAVAGRPGTAAERLELVPGSSVWPMSTAESCTVLAARRLAVPGTVGLARSVGWRRFVDHSERCLSRSKIRSVQRCT